jgi:hypothetical protein
MMLGGQHGVGETGLPGFLQPDIRVVVVGVEILGQRPVFIGGDGPLLPVQVEVLLAHNPFELGGRDLLPDKFATGNHGPANADGPGRGRIPVQEQSQTRVRKPLRVGVAGVSVVGPTPRINPYRRVFCRHLLLGGLSRRGLVCGVSRPRKGHASARQAAQRDGGED